MNVVSQAPTYNGKNAIANSSCTKTYICFTSPCTDENPCVNGVCVKNLMAPSCKNHIHHYSMHQNFQLQYKEHILSL